MAFQPSRLYINSDDRISGGHPDFTIQLSKPIQNATSAEVSIVSFPFLVPPIPSYENKLYYTIIDSGVPRSFITTIDTTPLYSISSLVSALNFALQYHTVLASNGSPQNVSQFMTISQIPNASPNGGKLQWVWKEGFLDYQIRFEPYVQDNQRTQFFHNLSYRLGWPQKTNNFYSTPGDFEIGERVWSYPSILRTTNVYVQSDFSSADNFTTNEEYNILCKVPIPNLTSTGDMVLFNTSNNPSHFTIRRLPSNISKITVRLLDDNFMPLELPADGENSVHISILLKYNDIGDKIFTNT